MDILKKGTAMAAAVAVGGVSCALPAAKVVDAFTGIHENPGIYTEAPERLPYHRFLYGLEDLTEMSATGHSAILLCLPVPDHDLFYLQDAIRDQRESAWVGIMPTQFDDSV
ncbi:MAG: hypothetical protein FVQ81_18450 [Candidatus Glassbacteria bacterium]|nr:hypothetical protein [Candidatus Glassbacteria bacterium]